MTYDYKTGNLQVFSSVDESLILDIIVPDHIQATAIYRALKEAENRIWTLLKQQSL